MVTSSWGKLSRVIGGRRGRSRGGRLAASRHIVMCNFAGCLPVMMDARVGLHTGDAEYALVKRIPWLASASMRGVRCRSEPYPSRSAHPMSSTKMNRTLGRCCAPADDTSKNAGRALRKQPLITLMKSVCMAHVWNRPESPVAS